MTTNTGYIPRILQGTVLGLISAFAIYGQAQVQISGHISDQASAAPIAGLAITMIQPPSGSSPPPRLFRTTSRSDGSYSASVPPGSYRICVEEMQGYLDPCQWSLGSSDFVVSAATVKDVALLKGRQLIVRILDSADYLRVAPSAAVVAPAVSISIVDSSGKTRLIPFRKTVGAVHEFSLLAPLASYTLRVSSAAAALAGPDGTALTTAGYSAIVNTAVAPATPPSWLPIWLSDRSARASTIVALSVVAAK